MLGQHIYLIRELSLKVYRFFFLLASVRAFDKSQPLTWVDESQGIPAWWGMDRPGANTLPSPSACQWKLPPFWHHPLTGVFYMHSRVRVYLYPGDRYIVPCLGHAGIHCGANLSSGLILHDIRTFFLWVWVYMISRLIDPSMGCRYFSPKYLTTFYWFIVSSTPW